VSVIRAYWWRGGGGQGNFGDQLTPFLCERLSGRAVEHAEPHLADVIACGSVLEPVFWAPGSWERYRGFIWGAGRMYRTPPMGFPNAYVLAVRGRRTLQRISCPSRAAVLLGDPGLLSSLFVRRKAKRFQLGIVPHWSEREHPLVRQIASGSPRVTVIDVCQPVQEVIDCISECEAIVASSLHGLVVADALDIPNEWVRFGTSEEERAGMHEFKYRDYYSIYGMADKDYLRVEPTDTHATILARFGPYSRPGLTGVRSALLAAFPFR